MNKPVAAQPEPAVQPVPADATEGHKERRLSLAELIDGLIEDGMVDRAEGEKFKQERRYYKGDSHPLLVIAEQNWKSLKAPHPLLDEDTLTQWLADWCGLRYFHIDPLNGTSLPIECSDARGTSIFTGNLCSSST